MLKKEVHVPLIYHVLMTMSLVVTGLNPLPSSSLLLVGALAV